MSLLLMCGGLVCPQCGWAGQDVLRLADDPSRPQLHLTAPAGWVNDPNGLSWRNGEWHFFLQHNPFGVQPSWQTSDTSWLHLVSTDLLHWRSLGDAIVPDRFGIMASGSAVTDATGTAGFGTNAHVLVYTALSRRDGREYGVQCLAWSNDGRTYRKYAGNPVLPAVDGGADRDPRVFWHEPTRRWVMALYAERGGNCVYDIFTSPDLKAWTLASEIDPGCKVGTRGWLFECPGLEELKIEGEDATAWVIWGAKATECQVGDFDGRSFVPCAPKQAGGIVQSGNPFYAAQTFGRVPDGRCLWVPWFTLPYREGALWRNCSGLVQELTLRRTADGLRLVRRPIRELKGLRKGAAVPFEAFEGEIAEVSIDCRLAKDGHVTFDLRGMRFSYDAAKGTLTDPHGQAHPWQAMDGRFAVTVFLDRGCAEMFSADGLAMMPLREVLTDASKRRLAVVESRGVTDGRFVAWHLNSIWKND